MLLRVRAQTAAVLAEAKGMELGVSGAAGAMGRRVVAAAAASDVCRLVAAVERAGHPRLGEDAGTVAGVGALGVQLSDHLTARPDVLVDFSTPEAAVALARECAARGVAVAVCATGLSADQRASLEREVAGRVPVLVAPNTSLGMNILYHLAEWAVEALPPGYDVEIIEAHHRRKKDSPSGTALELARRLCAVLGRTEGVLRHGRAGAVGPRTPDEIGMHAVRGGDIVGDHTVVLAGPGERLEITHRVSTRDVFALGAIEAAGFLARQSAGLYSMADVLR
jgi:4-hydroxy-tetrahydrodipicolinate reductase